jgi:hypothetical protein
MSEGCKLHQSPLYKKNVPQSQVILPIYIRVIKNPLNSTLLGFPAEINFPTYHSPFKGNISFSEALVLMGKFHHFPDSQGLTSNPP